MGWVIADTHMPSSGGNKGLKVGNGDGHETTLCSSLSVSHSVTLMIFQVGHDPVSLGPSEYVVQLGQHYSLQATKRCLLFEKNKNPPKTHVTHVPPDSSLNLSDDSL